MRPSLRRRGLAALLAAVLAACNGSPTMSQAHAEPVAGYVTDLPAFERFIATRPTPAEFRRSYPDVTLVLPGEMATKEFRMNNSRYFAQLDAQGRISGGRFQ